MGSVHQGAAVIVGCFCRAVCAAIVSLSACAYGADWPQFRGPDANCISSETGINKSWHEKPPKVLWTKLLGGQSWTAPIPAGGKLIIRNRKALACIDLK